MVDRAVLDELTGGDDDLAESILGDYVDSSGADLAALRAALAGRDADGVRRTAHRIHGASRTSARTTSPGSRRLEAAATSVEDWPSLRSTAEELEVAMARVTAAVNRTAVPG